MTDTHLFWMFWVCLAASGLANLGFRALRSFSRHDLQEVSARHNNLDRFGEILRQHESVALGIEMLTWIISALAIISGALWTANRWGWSLNVGALQLLASAVVLARPL